MLVMRKLLSSSEYGSSLKTNAAYPVLPGLVPISPKALFCVWVSVVESAMHVVVIVHSWPRGNQDSCFVVSPIWGEMSGCHT